MLRWVHAFGMPFERAVKYHRFLGAIAYTCVTVHMWIWVIKWIVEGNLLNNLFSVDNLIIGPNNYTTQTDDDGYSCIG